MIRLIVVVEGQSEEAFVKDVLAPHLEPLEVYTSATIVGKVTAQRRRHSGRGGGHFRHWRRDIQRLLHGDSSADLRVTTLFDLYGLPEDFPGLEKHASDKDTIRRCEALQDALGAEFNDRRLVPYLQRHEFETLVLGSLSSLGELLDAEDDLRGLSELEHEIDGLELEDINDNRESAPSKRLLAHIPSYNKVNYGTLAIEDTGLETLRGLCPRFNAWLTVLEALSPGKLHK